MRKSKIIGTGVQYAVRSEGGGRINIGPGMELPKFEAGLSVQGIDFLVPGPKVYDVARTDRTGSFGVPPVLNSHFLAPVCESIA